MAKRTPKNVTPPVDDTPDIPDDVMAAIEDPSRASTKTRGRSLEELRTELVPLADTIRATISDIALIPIARATPEQRTQLVELRTVLDAARGDLSTWVDAIDISFRRAAIETQANEFVLADGIVTVEPPRGEWVVNVPALRDELKAFAASGVISQEEFDSIFKTEVVTKADGNRLRYFGEHRGTELAEAIARNRVWKQGDPNAAKVKIKRSTR